MRILRSILAIVCGLFLLSLVAEGIEFAIVTALHGSVTDDPNVYLGIRNRPAILASKLAYNTSAAFLAGYAAAWIAGRAALLHGAILAVIQLALFIWGMLFSQYMRAQPQPGRVTLVPLMGAGICFGALFQARRRAADSGPVAPAPADARRR